MSSEAIRETIKAYIVNNFIFEENGHVRNDQPLLRSGVIDSTGILELITFLEGEFGVRFKDAELVADNFDTVDRLTAAVARKLALTSLPN